MATREAADSTAGSTNLPTTLKKKMGRSKSNKNPQSAEKDWLVETFYLNMIFSLLFLLKKDGNAQGIWKK